MTAASRFRLEGLEPDNLLAFLALLGLLRALEAADRKRPQAKRLFPRAGWDLDQPPVRPVLFVVANATREEVVQDVASGAEMLAAAHNFDDRKARWGAHLFAAPGLARLLSGAAWLTGGLIWLWSLPALVWF
jgi:hypothetical protein